MSNNNYTSEEIEDILDNIYQIEPENMTPEEATILDAYSRVIEDEIEESTLVEVYRASKQSE